MLAKASDGRAAEEVWGGSIVDGASFTRRPVAWERVHAPESGHWDHHVVWCQRPEGSVAIHRFTPRHSDADMLASLADLARQEMAECGGHFDTASNIGGFHGERNLWARSAVQQSPLPAVIGSAVTQASQLEARCLNRLPITTTPDEAWFNMLKPGSWNQLHTHAGMSYSGVFYISDEGKADAAAAADQELQGRLCLVPNEPDTMPEWFRPWGDYHLEQVRASTAETDHRPPDAAGLPPAAKRQRTTAAEGKEGNSHGDGAPSGRPPEFLLIDPVPGSCVVFPGFLPHFVIPTARARSSSSSSSEASAAVRLSAAFNFGSCEPVSATMWVQQDDSEGGGGPYVKVFLEAEPVFGIA